MSIQINGSNGKYDNIIKNESEKYGKNSVDNYMQYMSSPIENDNNVQPPVLNFSADENATEQNIANMEKYLDENDKYLNSLPPLEFEYRYLPNSEKFDKEAVKAAAYEEMQAESIPVEEFEQRFLVSDDMTAKPIDINNDGNIDTSEYATSIIASDILSKDTNDITKVDGTVNAKGMNAILAYSQKSNADAAAKLYADIYKAYNLGE